MSTHIIEEIRAALHAGRAIPYLGAGVLELAGAECPVPATPLALVGRLTAKASVPGKIRNNLTAAAQFIENFKHRKTVSRAMTEAFGHAVPPTVLHDYLATLPTLPLLVHAWYDDLPQRALQASDERGDDWAMVQGVSQAEHFGNWVHWFATDGARMDHMDRQDIPASAATLLYQPLGSIAPAANFLVSDSDFVEVLTEIDIQTPIPEAVQQLRIDRHFLFLGCRFSTQLERIFARQIMKRSSGRHWAVIPGELTRNERRFLEDQGIERVDLPLGEFVAQLMGDELAKAG
ncbi:MAG: SIR2 family protein [Gammaproteobacteria bacterium]|nr:SIR2 family protein [Gammaproteobacteria bacterium]